MSAARDLACRMMNMTSEDFPRLIFIHEFGEREAYEAQARGYLGHVVVELATGQKVPVVFWDAVRLRQDLQEETRHGNPFIAEAGMIVLDHVTPPNMETAVRKLAKAGFFESFRTLA